MVMSEVSLSRIEELPHTIALELRPALANGDPAVLFADPVHRVLDRSATGCCVAAEPVGPAAYWC
jgi:hypothetical protein